MDCSNEFCPVVTPIQGLCEDCSFEQLDAEFGTAQALKIMKIIYGTEQ
jgi:hypothetical protein